MSCLHTTDASNSAFTLASSNNAASSGLLANSTISVAVRFEDNISSSKWRDPL